MISAPRAGALACGLVLVLPTLAACGGDEDTVIVYNAQHEELIAEMAEVFTEETGIEVELRSGEDFELANQLVQEGDSSPADVFLTENSPAMNTVDEAGLFAELPGDVTGELDSQYVAADGAWTGFAARSTVLVYNTDALSEDELPDSILDLADPQWAGRIGYAPSGADFQAIVSAVLQTEGEQATRDWLAGLESNGGVYDNNITTMEAVNAGEIDAGIIYHYYWYRDQEEAGENTENTELHYFGNQDPGAFVSLSGAGVLASSEKPSMAEQFVGFLVGEEGQQLLAESYALEYPLNPTIDLGRGVPPLSSLEPPRVDVSALNGEQVIELLQEANFL